MYYGLADSYIEGVRHSNMFGTRDPKHHARQRKAFGPAFTMSAVAGLEEYIDRCIDVFVETVAKRFVDDKKERNDGIDPVKWIQYFAVSVSYIEKLPTLDERYVLMHSSLVRCAGTASIWQAARFHREGGRYRRHNQNIHLWNKLSTDSEYRIYPLLTP
jgi:hypothetical protein